MRRGKFVYHRNRPKLEGGFQDRFDRLPRRDEDHHVPGMGMQDCHTIREFLIKPVVDFGFPRNVPVTIQLVAIDVTDEDLIGLKMPVTFAPAVAWCDANLISYSRTDVPTRRIR